MVQKPWINAAMANPRRAMAHGRLKRDRRVQTLASGWASTTATMPNKTYAVTISRFSRMRKPRCWSRARALNLLSIAPEDCVRVQMARMYCRARNADTPMSTGRNVATEGVEGFCDEGFKGERFEYQEPESGGSR